jgi:nuclear transport factor 2 (NTF2) superfamily protein
VRFAYEWHDDSGNWFRSYSNENWEVDEHGLMRRRIASINDLPIKEGEREYHWPPRRHWTAATTGAIDAWQQLLDLPRKQRDDRGIR